MATTIKLKNGSGAPLAGDLVQGEPALDLTNKRLYTEDSGGSVIEIGSNPTSLTTGTFTSTGIDDNATSTAITIDASENVGIGTASPSVYGKTTLVQTTNASSGGLAIVDSTLAQSAKLWCDGTNAYLSSGNSGGDPLILNAGGGNVGIGTASPTAPLHVAGGGAITSIADWITNDLCAAEFELANPPIRLGIGYVNDKPAIQGFNNSTVLARDLLFQPDGGNVGIGTDNPAYKLDVSGSARVKTGATATPFIVSTGGDSQGTIRFGSASAEYSINGGADYLSLRFNTNSAERMRIDNSGNVGIGTDSPQDFLHVSGSGAGTFGRIRITGQSNEAIQNNIYGDTSGNLIFQADEGNAAASSTMRFSVDGSERMRIDSSGNLLVGKTGSGLSATGHTLGADGYTFHTRDSAEVLYLNRQGTDGSIVNFYKDETTVGSIGKNGTAFYFAGSVTGIRFGSTSMSPTDADGSGADNQKDLGASTIRWDDVYATNGTIQTSDVNEKQDIEALSEAETRVAVAAKGLLRKFRWKSAVEEKGDDARIHFGIIAQDLQAAFEAEGLDAGRYAMFIHSTWTDEETGEERSRMGVRYSELLAFIIATI